MKWIAVNGHVLPANEAKISVHDLSYLYGEGVFETFRSHDGQLLFLEHHLARLEWSCTFLNIPFTAPEAAKLAQELLQKNQLKEARFKIVVSQNQTDNPNDAPSINQIMFCEALDMARLARPFKLKTIHSYKNDDGILATLKTTNYLAKRLARQEAIDHGFDDGILLNHKNQVTECTTGNLFWVDQNGVLKTILKDCHHLPGIMKKQVLDLMQKHKLKCSEEIITANEFSHAREIFMTNAVLGIKPVVMVDHRQISGGEPGDITLMLQDLWQKHLTDLINQKTS